MEDVAVIGASNNEERYSNKAMKMLLEYGHNPIPVAPAVETVMDRKVYARLPTFPARSTRSRSTLAPSARKGCSSRSGPSIPSA